MIYKCRQKTRARTVMF